MNFLPIQINEAQLEALSITDGQLIFVKDKPAIYLDVGETRYSILLKATESTAGIVQPDNDTIKVNDGVISADVVGNWVAGNTYPVGYFVSYNNAWYQCVTANNDVEWTAANWTLVADVAQYSAYLQAFMSSTARMMGTTIAPNGSTTTSNDTGVLMTKGGLNSSNFIMGVLGSGANNHGLTITSDSSQGYHIANILIDIIAPWETAKTYKVNYYVTYENKLYQCITEHTSGDTFDKTYWSLIGGSGGGTLSIWEANTDYIIGSIVVNETTIYQCNTEHTSGDTFDSTYWTSMTGEKGADGEDGFSPEVSLSPFYEGDRQGVRISVSKPDGTFDVWDVMNGEDGAAGANGSDGVTPETIITDISNGKRVTFKYTYEGGLNYSVSADIENGITPHIDETTKNWFLGETDTNVKAEGVDGITPEIDDATKHWFIDGEDTGVIAEGTVEINTDCAILYATFLADGWSDTVPYTQTVVVNSIAADNVPIVDISYSEDTSFWDSERKAYNCLTKMETIDNGVVAYCLDSRPESDFTVKLRIAGDVTGLTFVEQDEFEEFKSNIKTNSVFSEEEQIVGTWIDGRSLYKKTVVFEAPNQSSTQMSITEYEHNIENIDLIWFSGESFWVTKGICKVMAFQIGIADDLTPAYEHAFNCNVNASTIRIIAAPALEDVTVYATLLYLKTE